MKDYSREFVNLCLTKNFKVSIAESCTGGLISSKLTEIENSSKVFKYGLVTYSNDSKISFLKVPKRILVTYGAVSKETAKSMANGLSKISKVDLYIAITGIAGPGGGSKEKPVGLVYHAFLIKKLQKTLIIKKIYSGNRNEIREKAAIFSIRQSYTLLNQLCKNLALS